jgi:hypothetical protein
MEHERTSHLQTNVYIVFNLCSNCKKKNRTVGHFFLKILDLRVEMPYRFQKLVLLARRCCLCLSPEAGLAFSVIQVK